MLDFWNMLPSKGKRIVSIIFVFVLCIIITIAGIFAPLSQQQIDEINEQLEKTRKSVEEDQGLKATSIIFGNNFMICLMMFIPFFGPFFGTLVLYNTGTAIAALSKVYEYNPLLAFLFLFIFPFTWLEFIAYSVAFTQSIWLIWRIIQRKGKREIVNTCILIAICAVMLFVAAIVEVVLISALRPATI